MHRLCIPVTMPTDLGHSVVSSGQETEGVVGTVLQDSFKLMRLIGQGGMGTVYEGTQLRLNKRVAIKLLSRQLTANKEALARFRREAEVTSHWAIPDRRSSISGQRRRGSRTWSWST